MFKSVISQTPFTSEAANEFFAGKIDGDSWVNNDRSFISTLRALLANRIGEGERIDLHFGRSSYSDSDLKDISTASAMRAIVSDWTGVKFCMRIHNFTNPREESNMAWMTLMESSFESNNPGWHRVEKVTVFFRKVFDVLCYINPDLKSVILFTNNMDVRRMHYLQCGIFAFLPWYFDQEKGVSEAEMALINSLREKTSDKYESCLAKIAEQFDFQTERIKRLLKGFETRYEQIQADQVRRKIQNLRRNLETLDDQIASILNQKRDNENLLLGLEMKIAQGTEDSEIMDYFLTNRHLILKNVEGSLMEFVVKAPLDYFDEDAAERLLNNDSSYFYGYTDYDTFTRENLKMLFSEIFLTQRLKVQFCSAYRFNLEGSVQSMSEYSYYGVECNEYTPNPHIDRYNCMGNYKRIINDRLAEHDYIGALEQCIASCKSLNILDSPVMNEFVARICDRSGSRVNKRCIVLPDGSVVKPKAAIEWLLKEKQATEAAEAAEAHTAEEGTVEPQTAEENHEEVA